jgi:hypothetical protein
LRISKIREKMRYFLVFLCELNYKYLYSAMKHSHYLSLSLDDENNIIVKKKKYNIQIKDQYKNDVACPICYNGFNSLKNEIAFLECGHKCCYVCLESNMRINKVKNFMCPLKAQPKFLSQMKTIK